MDGSSDAAPKASGSETNVSFREVLTGIREKVNAGKAVAVEENKSSSGDWFEKSLIVRMKTFEALLNIKGILLEMGLSEGMIRYLGGMMVMISFKNEEHAEMANDEIKGREEEFVSVDIWKGQELKFERLAWLRIFGVPLNILSNDLLDKVGKLFGEIIKPAQHDWDDVDLSSHYVSVLVDHGKFIQDEVYLQWHDKRVKVMNLGGDEMEIIGNETEKNESSPASEQAGDDEPAELILEKGNKGGENYGNSIFNSNSNGEEDLSEDRVDLSLMEGELQGEDQQNGSHEVIIGADVAVRDEREPVMVGNGDDIEKEIGVTVEMGVKYCRILKTWCDRL
ncbi:hypothetical protein L1987_86641 [Smallanthus sonchifolius]|uniref:Uncharacterized protein n=1 Tax=Smallanthus sonchifolius TaxID=185202 RepID=A0ACB8Y0L9_9ASTR|nr:hypothetical protein L1987_86641 [Smallanthus sonchifolius]